MLKQQQVERFFEQGFLIIPSLFNQDELELIANKANHLKKLAYELGQNSAGKIISRGTQFVIDKIGDDIQISRIVWAGAAEPDLLNLARQDKLLSPVAQILTSNEADHLINQLHYKLPHDNVSFTWHQDIYHRLNYDSNWQDLNGVGSFVQTIIAIDPMTINNGAIFIIPKSNHAGILSRQARSRKGPRIFQHRDTEKREKAGDRRRKDVAACLQLTTDH